MKIIHIIPAYKPAYVYGGPTMSVAKLCEALVEVGTDVEVFTTTANGLNELDVVPGKKVVVDGVPVTYFKRLTKDHTHFSPALLWSLRKKIKEQSELIIHIHSWWNLVSIFTCWIAKIYNVPVVLTPRGMLTQYTTVNRNASAKSIIHNFLGKKLLKYCHIHATSEKEKRDILEIIEPKSITVIYNLVNLPPFVHRPSNNEQRTTIKLLFLSRIEEKKGLELLFEALYKLSIPWQLSIAGSGNENYVENLKKLTQDLQLDNRVSWLGQIKNEEKFRLLAVHDTLALTSYNENFANVVIESLSVGTSVLISDQVGLADYVSSNSFGWVTDLTIENIQKNLLEAYEGIDLRDQIRRNAPTIIASDFNESYLIQKYIELYKQLI